MFSFFSAFNKDRLWDFKGGIHPPEMKLQTSGIPLRYLPLPNSFIVPLQQHLGPEGNVLVNMGDHVLKGQPLSCGKGRVLPVHAPTSGTVTAIAMHTTAHPSGLPDLCVHIQPDGLDRWTTLKPLPHYQLASAVELLDLIHQAGIAGLGGAGFPTAAKLESRQGKISTLIINAAECEPYITADDRLMQEHASEILEGCRILHHIIQPEHTIIGIEDNKPQAIKALQQALSQQQDMKLQVIPTKYPSGGAKQLTKILTGKEVPFGHHSASIGILMQNVGTAFAIKRAIIDGEPLIERVITLTGEALQNPGNVWGRVGTPVQFLLEQAQYCPSDQQPMVIMGGPLMGFTLSQLNIPMVKISNCLLAPSAKELSPPQPEQPCIRCSKCVDACPAGLLPQQLFWFSQGKEHEKARQHHLFDCIECGACAYVCPSNIPLVHYYRQEKAEIRAIDQETEQAQKAKLRFEAKKNRLEQEKLARQQRHQQAAARLSDPNRETVQAALARIHQQQAEKKADSVIVTQLPLASADHNQHHLISNAPTTANKLSTGRDLHKVALANPLAPVVAKQVRQDTDTPYNTAQNCIDSHTEDPRKAAVAAAIARVKAKKAQHNGHVNLDNSTKVTMSCTEQATDISITPLPLKGQTVDSLPTIPHEE